MKRKEEIIDAITTNYFGSLKSPLTNSNGSCSHENEQKYRKTHKFGYFIKCAFEKYRGIFLSVLVSWVTVAVTVCNLQKTFSSSAITHYHTLSVNWIVATVQHINSTVNHATKCIYVFDCHVKSYLKLVSAMSKWLTDWVENGAERKTTRMDVCACERERGRERVMFSVTKMS